MANTPKGLQNSDPVANLEVETDPGDRYKASFDFAPIGARMLGRMDRGRP